MVIPKDRQIERRRRNAPSFERKGKCSYSATTVTTSTTDLGEVDEGEGKISLVRNIHGARRGEFFFLLRLIANRGVGRKKGSARENRDSHCDKRITIVTK